MTLTSVHLPSMDAEGAASGAPADDAQLAEQPLEVAAASATVITEPLASTTEAPSADLEVKEEVDFSDPAEAADPEVETVDLLGIEEIVLQPTTTTSTPSIAVEEGAALSAPAETAEPSSQVVEGAGPSAPSRPPRTRGTRGGKDKQYQTVRRAYWQGFEQLKAWLESHSRPKSGRRGFNLQRVDFDRASGRFQELLVNWTFFVGRATAQQILCEVEFLVPEYADWVDHHGYNGEGGQLASHVRRKTPTIATLYAEADSNQVERTYSQLWEEAEARDWEEGHSHDPPVRRRVPVAKAQGAASSAPSGRSSSISGWVGRDFVPEEEAKGKGSKGKWIPKSTSETPAKASVPSPKTPEGPPPPHHPRQPKTPPPGRDPQVGKGTGSIPPPPSNPPTVFIPPRPKERPQSRPPVVRTPPVPPPPKSAQRPVENPSVSPTVTVKSTKVDPIQVGPDVTTPGVSASPDPQQPEGPTAPAEGAASGAPQDPEPEGESDGEWEEEEGEEEAQREEDPLVEVAESSQQEEEIRPPAVVLRGRSAVREPRPSRTSLTDRPVVLRPAASLSQQYQPTRIDQSGTWSRVAPATAALRQGLTSVAVQRDLYNWGSDPHSHSDELWRDPESISAIRVPDPAIVTAFEDIDPPTEEEGQERGAAPRAPDQAGEAQQGEAEEVEEVEEVEEEFDEEDIEQQFLAKVKPPSRPQSRQPSRAASATRQVFLEEDSGAAPSAPSSGRAASVGTGAAAPSAPERRKRTTKIPTEEPTESLSPPPVSDSGVADTNWFVEHTYLETQYPVEPKVPGQTSKQPQTKGVFKDPPESLRRQTPKAESAADSASVPKHKGPPIIPGVNKAVKPPPPPARAPPTPQEAGTSATSSRPDPPDLPGAAKGAPAVDRSRSRTHTSPSQIDYSCLVEDERPGIGVHFAFDTVGGRSPGKVTVGLDWHQVISPHGVDRYCYPTPLLVLQLRELAEDYNIQYWVVSFTGHSGARQAKQDISTFVAACVSIHGLPFCGFRITKAPIGPWGKAAIVPELGIQLFVDDRPDIVNEVKRTGIFTHLATGRSTSWTNDLLRFFQQEDRGRAQNLVATPLRKDQFSKEPPGRRGY